MDKFLKSYLKIKEKDGIMYSASDNTETVVIDRVCDQKTIDYINQNLKCTELLVVDPGNFDFLDAVPQIKNLQIFYSYMGSKKKEFRVDFSPLYRHHLRIIGINASPKLIFSTPYDIARQEGAEKLKINYNHVCNLENAQSLRSLHVNWNGAETQLNFLKNKGLLQYLTLQDCTLKTLEGLDDASNLSSLTVKGSKIYDSTGLRGLKSLKNLFMGSFVCDDISIALRELHVLEYINLGYMGKISDVLWINEMPALKVFICSCKILNGDLSACDKIPYAKINVECSHYNRLNNDLSKKITGSSIAGIPTYTSF